MVGPDGLVVDILMVIVAVFCPFVFTVLGLVEVCRTGGMPRAGVDAIGTDSKGEADVWLLVTVCVFTTVWTLALGSFS